MSPNFLLYLQVFDTWTKKPIRKLQKPFIEEWSMVWRSLSGITFSDANNYCLVAESNLEKKYTEFNWKVSHPFKTAKWNQNNLLLFEGPKKCCFLGKSTKKSKLILCFSEMPKIFIFVRVRQIGFYFSLKKVICLKQCPLYGFHFTNV